MKTSQKCIDLIKKFEGCALKAYKCPAKVWTIGYGHTNNVRPDDVISKSEAEELLRIDLAKFEAGVNAAVKVKLTQGQFDALVSFAYNLGTGALQGSTLLKLLNAGNYTGAAAQFDKWIYAGGKILLGLQRRRAAEKELFLST
jgi:lysozyme